MFTWTSYTDDFISILYPSGKEYGFYLPAWTIRYIVKLCEVGAWSKLAATLDKYKNRASRLR